MVGRRQKIEKKQTWTPESSPPKNVNWTKRFKWFKISYLEWTSSVNIISEHYQSFVCLFFNFLAESLKANKNLQKRSLNLQYSFAQKTSHILQTSTHSTLKNTCSLNTAKNLSHFTNFLANIRLVSEKTLALHHFLPPKNCILEALWKQISEYSCISQENFGFRDVVSFYLLLSFICWITSLRRLAVWATQNF